MAAHLSPEGVPSSAAGESGSLQIQVSLFVEMRFPDAGDGVPPESGFR